MALRHDQLKALQTGVTVEVARTTEAIREAQALRHQVYCLERKMCDVAPTAGIEQDRFDPFARHIVLRRTSDRAVVATSRIVRSQMAQPGDMLPMQQYCDPAVFRGLPMETVGEISRFAISKEARGEASGPELRLALLSGILEASRAMGLTHWCAVMEPSLIRLLAATGLRFEALGPLVELYGLRQPCVARITRAVAQGRQSHPRFYEMVTARTQVRAA